MRRLAALLLALLAWPLAPAAIAAGPSDYTVLIISRERLEVGTPCEIGLYMQDQLVGRLFQEQSMSFNLPPGQVSIRLRTLPGAAFGCDHGMGAPDATTIVLHPGQIQKYRIVNGLNGLSLRPATLNYPD
ncbi:MULTISPECIES: hypothetical protein [unclassified Pseudomonas]|uniref:hypothetical protein n=1 Tax=unclassified Pseudomonas TaxID=196821 RepID=UPI000BD925E1|nr:MULTISPECIES: hypothetical protein [unclassified Pseudomonas]PVZ09801.1 hypothetical protein F474_04374 [Pseudomonas sp. URIL14HWK12:I12]PVZ21443.1 hypothetical protein F470_04238 [Pseudomonas sp. URIL14HWK12:I10]PVZ30376.1 hypothetical protein F472_04377 [Pseudomonas sp. URIL14HWK12:I11]SNZ18673.1 hypothetical protein SAMN05660463_04251 [Pseudomonas sp. URIL14HWK12:I9]